MKKLKVISQSKLNETMNMRRIELVKMGYFRLSRNIFMNNKNVIILKSMVRTTNPRESKSLSLKKDMYYTLQNKCITIEIFERNCYRSKKTKMYNFKIQNITPTGQLRNRKNKTYRFLIDERISPSNTYLQTLVYDKKTA